MTPATHQSAPRPETEPETVALRASRSPRGHFQAAALSLDRHPALLLFGLILLYLPAVIVYAQNRPLWHDELFTYYISDAPTMHTMLQETRTVDLNPPLSYFLTRAVFHFARPSRISARVPSILGGLLAIVCTFFLLKKRLGALYGALAALLLLTGGIPMMKFFDYADEARPYTLILGFLALAILCWQSAVARQRRPLALAGLALAGFGILLSHIVGILGYGALFLAELLRARSERPPGSPFQIDFPVWIALLLPLASFATYGPMLHNHNAGAFPPAFSASLVRATDFYRDMLREAGVYLLIPFALVLFLGWDAASAQSAQPSPQAVEPRPRPTRPEIGIIVVLLLSPLIVNVLFMHSHAAFFPRYGIAALLGVSLLVPWFLGWWTRGNRSAALLTIFVLFCFFTGIPLKAVRLAIRHKDPLATDPNGGKYLSPTLHATTLDQLDPSLPIVANSGLTFLEMDHRKPELAPRLYYLEDHAAAMKYAHANIFEGFTALRHVFPIRAHVEDYSTFLSQHHEFFVYGTYDYPEDWLLRKLQADGATLIYEGPLVAGYKDEDLYKVIVNPALAPSGGR